MMPLSPIGPAVIDHALPLEQIEKELARLIESRR